MKLYIITNGSSYLTLAPSNAITTTYKSSLAQKYTKEKAKNVLKNLPKSYKNIGFRIEEIIEEESLNFEQPTPTQDITNILKEKSEILEKVSEFEHFMTKMCQNREELFKALSQVDSEIQDILHAAEFYTLNAAEGYKLYKLLHEKRVERRKIKDFIEIVGYLEETSGKGFSNLIGTKRILGKDSRKYEPRVLKELFKKEK